MAWSEKAIEEAVIALKYAEGPELTKDPTAAMRRALDAAAAVDGDAQWNAAIEAVTFWLPKSKERREEMAKAFEEIANVFRNAPPETGLD